VSPRTASADRVLRVDAPSGEDASGVSVASVSGSESLGWDPCADVVVELLDVKLVFVEVDGLDDLGELSSIGSNVASPAGLVNAPRLTAPDSAICPDSEISGAGEEEADPVDEPLGSGSSSGG